MEGNRYLMRNQRPTRPKPTTIPIGPVQQQQRRRTTPMSFMPIMPRRPQYTKLNPRISQRQTQTQTTRPPPLPPRTPQPQSTPVPPVRPLPPNVQSPIVFPPLLTVEAKIDSMPMSRVSFRKLEQYGRLGNQMFQIATVLGYADKHKMKPGFVAWRYNCFMKQPLPTLPPGSQHDAAWLTHQEPSFKWNPIPEMKSQQSLDLCGYFQSEKYFHHIRDYLVNEIFALHPRYEAYITKRFHDLIEMKSQKPFQTIGVHIRKGDYVGGDYHVDLQSDYYVRAWKALMDSPKFDKQSEPIVLICSDDIAWCKSKLKDVFVTGMEKNHSKVQVVYVENEPDIVDLYLLSKCHHNIIANSSFSWWAAYLNRNKNHTTIAPRNWFGPSQKIDTSDLLPSEWIQV